MTRVAIGREARTAAMVWRREMIRSYSQPARLASMLIQPILYLFVLGKGLSNLIGSTGGLDYSKFLFPGVIAMSIVGTALFSGASILWDREFGFLREMMVAPVSRTSIILGKASGGATAATLQGAVLLLLAPLIGIDLGLGVVLELLLGGFLLAVTITCLGILLASRMKRMESFQAVTQMLLFPMIFLSGITFPLRGLPDWLTWLTRLNPLTYGVDPLRQAVLGSQDVPPEALARFSSNLEFLGHRLGMWEEFAILAILGAGLLTMAALLFSRRD